MGVRDESWVRWGTGHSTKKRKLSGKDEIIEGRSQLSEKTNEFTEGEMLN